MKISFITSTLILFVLLLVTVMAGCAAPVPETVVFPDENLDAVIIDALDKTAEGTITPAELAGLTVLAARGLPRELRITDLSGIEYCTNLSEIDLDFNQQISDISPLVANSGLSEEDDIQLDGNNLDLSEGSEDLENIRILEERGVDVEY